MYGLAGIKKKSEVLGIIASATKNLDRNWLHRQRFCVWTVNTVLDGDTNPEQLFCLSKFKVVTGATVTTGNSQTGWHKLRWAPFLPFPPFCFFAQWHTKEAHFSVAKWAD